jgi:hypothetical protein
VKRKPRMAEAPRPLGPERLDRTHWRWRSWCAWRGQITRWKNQCRRDREGFDAIVNALPPTSQQLMKIAIAFAGDEEAVRQQVASWLREHGPAGEAFADGLLSGQGGAVITPRETT